MPLVIFSLSETLIGVDHLLCNCEIKMDYEDIFLLIQIIYINFRVSRGNKNT